MELPEGVPPRPIGPPSHIRRWESQYGAAVRAAEEAAAAQAAVEAEKPKPAAKKKATKKKATKKKAGS